MIIKQLIILITSLMILTPVKGKKDNPQTITYNPIGYFCTPYTPERSAPRQGILKPDAKARIEILPEYREALQSLELFEYIIVLYHLDKSEGWHPVTSPPVSNPRYTFGLFATRSPNRPNPVGIAAVKLEKIEDGVLHISGTDAFDGTPVLDIKPYLPSIDAIDSPQNSLLEKELGLPGKTK